MQTLEVQGCNATTPVRTRKSKLPLACRWADQALPAHDWSKFMEAKRKELTRLNGAYGNTLKNAKVGAATTWYCQRYITTDKYDI